MCEVKRGLVNDGTDEEISGSICWRDQIDPDLERSGLKDASYLPTVGVQDIVSDLLGVDSDIQDHQISLFV